MRVLCAWCSRDLGTKSPETPGVTHTICPDCLDREFPKMKSPKRQAIEATIILAVIIVTIWIVALKVG